MVGSTIDMPERSSKYPRDSEKGSVAGRNGTADGTGAAETEAEATGIEEAGARVEEGATETTGGAVMVGEAGASAPEVGTLREERSAASGPEVGRLSEERRAASLPGAGWLSEERSAASPSPERAAPAFTPAAAVLPWTLGPMPLECESKLTLALEFKLALEPMLAPATAWAFTSW